MHLLARPHALALPLLVIWMAGIVRARDAGRVPSPALLPVMVLWCNLHGGFVVGLLFAGLLAGEAVLQASAAGMGALVVDVGYFFYARSVVQASANAAALAGAQEIGTGGAPLDTAGTYSSVAGEKNAVSNLTIAMVSGYPKLTCASTWAINSGVACSGNYTTSSCASPPCTPAVNLIPCPRRRTSRPSSGGFSGLPRYRSRRMRRLAPPARR